MRALVAAMALTALASTAHADRIKDLTAIKGVRDNHITGFGLVVGLGGTGDDTTSPVVMRALDKMLKRLGVTIDDSNFRSKNVAAVIVTAELPAFAKPGMTFDVTVSSMGQAKSLAGGTLLSAPLKGPDGKTWALAQGALSVGGFTASGASGSSSKKNQTTVGRIPGGGSVEASAPSIMPDKEIVLELKTPDFTTATRMRDAIDTALGTPGAAHTRDASSVAVTIPAAMRDQVPELIAQLEAIEVDPDIAAKVVIDEKTGTIVIGEAVRLRTAAITFGSLTVEIGEAPEISQPNALGKGKTKTVARSTVKVDEPGADIKVMPPAATVGDVAAALASLGAKPRDLVSILRALKAAGALRADLESL